MSKRIVTLLTPYRAGVTVNIARVDKYGNRVDNTIYTLNTDSEGKVTIELDIPTNSDCYFMFVEENELNDGGSEDFFWISEGEGILEIDMRLAYAKKSLPTFLTHTLEDAALNGERVLGYEWCEQPLESLEDKRFICRYGEFLEGKEDLPVCEIDEKMRENYKEQ